MQKAILKLALFTLGLKYYVDNFYIQQFLKDSMSIKNCDEERSCNFATLVYLGE